MRIYGRMRDMVRMRSRRVDRAAPRTDVVHHPGGPGRRRSPATILDEPKPCSVCKRPAITGTIRGRAVHMWCEKRWVVLPDEQIARIVHGVAA